MLLKLLGYSKPIPLHDHTDSRRTLRAIEHQKSGDPLGDPAFVTHVDHVTSADERQRKSDRILATRRAWAGVAAALALAILPAPARAGDLHLCGPNLCNGATVISQPQPAGTKVLEFHTSGNASRVVYVSNAACKRELFAVAATGGTVTKLSALPATVPSGNDPCFRNVTEFALSPDGTRAVYIADQDVTSARAFGDQDYELFSVPWAGGAVRQLNPPLPSDNDVEHFAISCDSRRVVYRQGRDAMRWELWSAPLDGATAAVRISQLMAVGQAVGEIFHVRCDGSVLYFADLTQSGGTYAPFLTTTTGGQIRTGIFVDGFEGGSAGAWR